MEKDMPGRYNDNEYMYGSAKIRVLETRMLGREGCERLMSAADADGVLNMLGDYGYTVVRKQDTEGKSRVDREATLMSALAAGFNEIAGLTPEPLVVRFLQYKYDCNNIKAAIKAKARGIKPDEMLFPVGTVKAEAAVEAVKTGNYESFPKHMALAAKEAAEIYLKTKNPQEIDLIVDRVCFSDMLDAANETGVPFIIRYVKTLIDLTNIMMCIRVQRMRAGNTGRGLIESSVIDGGVLGREFILEGYGKGEDEFLDRLGGTPYAAFADAAKHGAELSKIEREADRFIVNIVREVKWVPFGAELAVAYLIGLEYGLKNVRIIMAGKEAGLADTVIRERVREMYV
jgi:V/A-type H+-transporting ATPase subunit C